jgi:hypothetical protein
LTSTSDFEGNVNKQKDSPPPPPPLPPDSEQWRELWAQTFVNFTSGLARKCKQPKGLVLNVTVGPELL